MFGMGMCINLKPPKENEDRKIKGNVKKETSKRTSNTNNKVCVW
jgi:hypothetical protein